MQWRVPVFTTFGHAIHASPCKTFPSGASRYRSKGNASINIYGVKFEVVETQARVFTTQKQKAVSPT